MTKVRVISGKHTGAFIDWARPLMKVGASEDFDIYIGDWNAQTIELVRTPEGHCQAQWLAGSADLPVMGSQLEGNTYSCHSARPIKPRNPATMERTNRFECS